MNRETLRTFAFAAAGLLLLAQFFLQQIDGGLQASGIVLVAAAGIFLGLAVLRIRSPERDHSQEGIGVVEIGLLALVGVLGLITAGLAALVFV